MPDKDGTRTIRIESDDAKYQKYLTKVPEVAKKEYKPSSLATTKEGVYILTGKKTKEMGGGQSQEGFVMDALKVLGRINLVKADLMGESEAVIKRG